MLAVAILGASLLPLMARLAARPSAELLRDLAQIGATLFVAYAVEMSLLEKVPRAQSAARENRIGIVLGLGACGLFGIVVSLALAERAAVGHWMWLDEISFAGVSASLGFLGIVVALLPLFVHERSHILDKPE